MPSIHAVAASVSDAEHVASECRGLMRCLVEPARRSLGSAKVAHALVGRRLGLTPRRVRAYLLGEVTRVPAWEADRLRAAVERARTDRISELQSELDALVGLGAAAASSPPHCG